MERSSCQSFRIILPHRPTYLIPLLPGPNTTPRRGRILSRLQRIPNPQRPTPNQPPPLQILLDLFLHTTLIMFRFPKAKTLSSALPPFTRVPTKGGKETGAKYTA